MPDSKYSKLRLLDLFSGIGGFSYGLELSGGFETVAFCEIDSYCQKILKKHWPRIPIYSDIKELTGDQLRADGIVPDIITGGFPCTDISVAGKRKGIVGKDSGLWTEMFRLIKECQPSWAIIENVSNLRSKGLTLVLQNLSEIGYMGEFHSIPCSAIGGLHRRDRIWIIAYPNVKRLQRHRKGLEKPSQILTQEKVSLFRGRVGEKKWSSECRVPRILNGLPNRIQRIKALGNAVVPQIPQMIGEAIWKSHTTMNF